MVVLSFFYSFGNSILLSHIAAGATMIVHQSMVYPKVVLDLMVRERATGLSGVPVNLCRSFVICAAAVILVPLPSIYCAGRRPDEPPAGAAGQKRVSRCSSLYYVWTNRGIPPPVISAS